MLAEPAIDLARFLDAQGPVYGQVLRELTAGRKRSHWMWFVFPQLRGLGISSTAQFYGITGLPEARAYLRHPVLGERLRQCCRALLGVPRKTAVEILGAPDDLKLCSCVTLFAQVDPSETLFAEVLDRFFGGVPDARSLALLANSMT